MPDEGFNFGARRGAVDGAPAVAATYFRYFAVITKPTANRMCLNRLWALDYPYTSGVLTKAVKRNAPWFDRPPGTACLFPPGVPFWEDCDLCPAPFVASHITFFRGETLDLLRYVEGGKGFCVFHDRRGRLGDLLRQTALLAAQGGEAAFWKATGNLYHLADILHSSRASRKGGRVIDGAEDEVPADTREPLVERVRECLRKRLSEGVGLAELAKELGVSESSLSHKYKALTGESPMRTLAALRIAEARRLIAAGTSLKDTAARTGFCDEFHLSKTFKRLTGAPPSQHWR